MKILVIGGSRFVGKHLVKKLLDNGHTLTIFNRGNHTETYPKEVTYVKGDRDEGFPFTESFDAVIDMCAYTGEQTKTALDSIKTDYFLHFGTIAAYKKTEILPLVEGESEIGVWEAWGDYNTGKVECEKILGESAVKHGNIRPVYILGPDNYVDRENFIYQKIKKGEEIILPGNGQALVQFAFAYDVADVIVKMVENSIEENINVAGDELVTLKGLVEALGSIIGITPIIKYNPEADGKNQIDEEFPFANENMVGSNKKMKELGITPTKLMDGLREDFNTCYKEKL